MDIDSAGSSRWSRGLNFFVVTPSILWNGKNHSTRLKSNFFVFWTPLLIAPKSHDLVFRVMLNFKIYASPAFEVRDCLIQLHFFLFETNHMECWLNLRVHTLCKTFLIRQGKTGSWFALPFTQVFFIRKWASDLPEKLRKKLKS